MRPSSPWRPVGILSVATLTCICAVLAVRFLASSSTPDPPQPAQGSGDDPRIVSISPALTRTLVDLGLGEHIVGRTPWCRAVDEGVPVVGTLHEIDYEKLIRVRPTHIVIQPMSSGADPGLLELAESKGWVIGSWQMNTLEDVRRTIEEIPQVLPADEARSRELLAALDRVTGDGQGSWTGRTLLVDTTDPVRVYGRGTFLADLLERLGGVNAATQRLWAELSLEVLAATEFDAVIFVRHDDATVTPLEAAGPLAGLECVRDARLAVLQHPDANLPSSGMIGVATEMRRVLDELAETP